MNRLGSSEEAETWWWPHCVLHNYILSLASLQNLNRSKWVKFNVLVLVILWMLPTYNSRVGSVYYLITPVWHCFSCKPPGVGSKKSWVHHREHDITGLSNWTEKLCAHFNMLPLGGRCCAPIMSWYCNSEKEWHICEQGKTFVQLCISNAYILNDIELQCMKCFFMPLLARFRCSISSCSFSSVVLCVCWRNRMSFSSVAILAPAVSIPTLVWVVLWPCLSDGAALCSYSQDGTG